MTSRASALFCLCLCTALVDAAELASSATWRQAIGAAILGAPVAQGESVAAVCDDRSLRAYSQSGRELWRFYPEDKLLPFLTRSPEGTNFIADTAGNLIAVNRAGRQIWKRALGSLLCSNVELGLDGRIFAATRTTVQCFSGSGFLLWTRRLSSPPAIGPKSDAKGGVLIALGDNSLLNIGAFGTVRAYTLPGEIAAIAPGLSSSVAVAFRDGRLTLYPENGTSIATLGSRPLDLVQQDGKLAFLLADGTVGMIELSTGKQLWSGQAPASTEGHLYIDERGAYSLGRSGASGFAHDGRRLWTIRLSGSSAIPAFSDDGLLYSGGSDWILYAYRVEDRIRSTALSTTPLPGYGIAEHSPWVGEPFAYEESTLEAHFAGIEQAISRHDTGEGERNEAAWLREIAGAFRANTEQKTPSVLPNYRVRATALLGLFGSREDVNFLVDLFRRDSEPLVKCAAAEAIGLIGVDPGGRALDAFAEAGLRTNQDERLLATIVAATGSLCRFSGPPLSDRGIKLLTAITVQAQSSFIRSRAQSEIESFRIPSPGNRL